MNQSLLMVDCSPNFLNAVIITSSVLSFSSTVSANIFPKLKLEKINWKMKNCKIMITLYTP